MSDDGTVELKGKTGYKRPPVEHQFKKGHKGHARVKARADENFQEMFLKLADTPVAVNDNGKRRLMTPKECIAKRLLTSAAKGDPKAVDQCLRLMIKIEGDAPPTPPPPPPEEKPQRSLEEIMHDFGQDMFAESRRMSLEIFGDDLTNGKHELKLKQFLAEDRTKHERWVDKDFSMKIYLLMMMSIGRFRKVLESQQTTKNDS